MSDIILHQKPHDSVPVRISLPDISSCFLYTSEYLSSMTRSAVWSHIFVCTLLARTLKSLRVDSVWTHERLRERIYPKINMLIFRELYQGGAQIMQEEYFTFRHFNEIEGVCIHHCIVMSHNFASVSVSTHPFWNRWRQCQFSAHPCNCVQWNMIWMIAFLNL